MSKLTASGSTDLRSLASEINREHEAVTGAWSTALDHARRAGELLAEAKHSADHGGWMNWVEENFHGSYSTAALYMRIHRRWPEVQKLQSVETLGLNEVDRRLAEPRESEDDESEPEPERAPPPLPAGEESDHPNARRQHLENEGTWTPALAESVKGEQPAYDEIMGRKPPPAEDDDPFGSLPSMEEERGKAWEQKKAAAKVGGPTPEPASAVPDEKRPKPRPSIARLLRLIDAATAIEEVTDEQLESLPYNEIMGKRLRIARDVISRILEHHARG